MQATVVSLSIPQNLSLTLAELFAPKTAPQPCYFALENDTITLDSSLTKIEGKQDQITFSAHCGEIELVMLEQAKLSDLTTLINDCQLTITGVNAINQRLGVLSYRFAVTCPDIKKARAIISEYANSNQLEIALVEAAPSLNEPGLLLMDMDSTTIEIECIDEIAALAGVGEEVAEVTELAMQGKLDFAQSLTERVAKLKGADESVLAKVANELPLMPGLIELIKVLKENQWRVAIASGGFTYFADKLKSDLGLDAARANVLEIIDGKLTGKVVGGIVDAQVKAETLTELAESFKLPTHQMVAMGDGANDLVMMNAAQLGVAYKAKPVVLAQADSTICHGGLDCMLHWLK